MQRLAKRLLFCMLLSTCFLFTVCNVVYASEDLDEGVSIALEVDDVQQLEQARVDLQLSDVEYHMLENIFSQDIMVEGIYIKVCEDLSAIVSEEMQHRYLELTVYSEQLYFDIVPPDSTNIDRVVYFLQKIGLFEDDNIRCDAYKTERHVVQFVDYFEDGMYVTRACNSYGNVLIETKTTNWVKTKNGNYINIPIVEILMDTPFGNCTSIEDLQEKGAQYVQHLFLKKYYHNCVTEFSVGTFQKFDSVISL